MCACNTPVFVTDDDAGEIVCSKCGVVIEQNLADVGQEVIYTFEEYVTKRRTGSSSSLTMFDRGLSTVMGKHTGSAEREIPDKNKQLFTRLRVLDSRSRGKQEVALAKSLVLLNNLKGRMGLSDTICEHAAYIYRKSVNLNLIKGRTQKSVLLASLYISCRTHGVPRSLKELAHMGDINPKELSKSIRWLISSLDINLEQISITFFINKMASTLGITESTKRKAINLYESCKERKLTDGKHPMSQAAACLYLSCMLNNEDKTQRSFSLAASITDVTLRNRVKAIREALGI